MLLIANGRLVTRDSQLPYIENGGVCIEGDEIIDVGTTAALKALYPGAEFIDAAGGVIMPGLINAHNHIYSAFGRGLSVKGHKPNNFTDVLKGLWWKLDENLSPEDVNYSALATYIDCIENGVTTVFDHHASYACTPGSLFVISEAAKKLGVRTCLCYEVSDRNGEQRMKEGVLENELFAATASHDETGMQCGMMGLHASFTLSDETLDFCREHTPEGVGFHIHAAEGIDDLYDSLKKHSKRVINRLFDAQILGKNSIAAHCIHINASEMDILAKTDTIVVHNPESNMGNAVGCGPAVELVRRGILTGLGTDGYTNDMLESLKVANMLQKHHLCHPDVAWAECPKMLFENNALIAGRFFAKPLGALKTGYSADVVIMDYDPLTPMDGDNCNSHILFGMNGKCANTTVVNGRVLMRNRVLTGIDKREVMEKSRECAAKLAKRINV